MLYVDENSRYFASYDGPGHHCDSCKREYIWCRSGPHPYGDDMWICGDCRREMYAIDHDLRDADLGIRYYEGE